MGPWSTMGGSGVQCVQSSSRKSVVSCNLLGQFSLSTTCPPSSLAYTLRLDCALPSPFRPHSSISQQAGVAMASAAGAPTTKVHKTDAEWQAVLSREQFRILRQKGTEYPGTGEYNKTKDDGVYGCAGCGTALYKSTTKFDSGCGWPAFFEGIPGAINETRDADGRRVEITCSACGGHLGHVFKGEGYNNPTDARHCVNSVSLKFTPANTS